MKTDMAVRKVPSAEFPTINAALTTSNPFDTIRVAEGIFPETLIIDKEGIRIIGAGKGKTIIDGDSLGPATSGITIEASLVTIENLTVQNFKTSGIFVESESNILHKVQVLNNKMHGIEVVADKNILVKCETNGNEQNGILLTQRIKNNIIILCKMICNKRNGILLERIPFVILENNLIYCCFAQKNSMDGFNVSGRINYIISSVAINNDGNGFGGNGDGNIFLSNKSINNKKNGFMNGIFTTLIHNLSKNNGLNGIYIPDSLGKMINNKIINNKQNGVLILEFEYIIDRNVIKNNQLAGIEIQQGGNAAIRSNCLMNNNPDLLESFVGLPNAYADNKCTTSMPPGLCDRNDVVNVPGDFDTINDAIHDADTLSGFTINIEEGIFHEQVNIPLNKNRLRIIGADQCKTIIDGTNIEGDGITIESDTNSIENLTVQNFKSNGVFINGINAFFNTIKGVKSIKNALDGFLFSTKNLDFSFIYLCQAKMNKRNGYNGADSDVNYFIKNHANKNNVDGFHLNNQNLLLLNETKENGNHGFEFFDDNKCVGNCALKNNGNGFFIDDVENLLFNNRAIENKKNGLQNDSGSSDNIIWGNVCNKNDGDGILVKDEDNGVIKNICQMNKGNGIQINEDTDVDNIIDNNCVENNVKAGIIIEQANADNFGIRSNCLSGNNPDIQNNSLEEDNIAIDENKCNSSIPEGLCEGSCTNKNSSKWVP
ncbi:pectinesterase family protein [Chengkuizengella sediminis]|uniref:pectinesterase family protein n=1 Tax=Chengkuizengella sediminis TaxID=1885917 RepID=UPI001389A2DD|nr:pectinesterase family protein [Chengkuizengella sediminis]NDI35596.1 hypothetical protein [Chengkuizengella sediminis]